jgi:hypothetical protein
MYVQAEPLKSAPSPIQVILLSDKICKPVEKNNSHEEKRLWYILMLDTMRYIYMVLL